MATAVAWGGCSHEDIAAATDPGAVPYEGGAYPPRALGPEATSGEDLIVVSRPEEDRLEFLDTGASSWLTGIPVGTHPVEVDWPWALSAHSEEQALYVLLAYPDDVNKPNGSHLHGGLPGAGYVQKLSLQDMRVLADARIDAAPLDMALSNDGKRLVVAHAARDTPGLYGDMRATISVLETETPSTGKLADPTRIPVCLAPAQIALSSESGQLAYVACQTEGVVAVVDTTNPLAAPRRIAFVAIPPDAGGLDAGGVRHSPTAVRASPTATLLAIAGPSSLRLLDADESSLRAEGWVLDGTPNRIAWSADESTIAVALTRPASVAVLGVDEGITRATRTLSSSECGAPSDVAFDGVGRTLYVLCSGPEGEGAILALDLDDPALAVLGRFPFEWKAERFALVRRP